ncbi:MAG: Uma2 family endonuclease [Treponema sp.]|jgi:hypothetical protein|nr:Uma2 family endonuclease [Treponema sp.]
MADLALSLDNFSYKDYRGWPENFRCELVDGVIYMMSSPNVWHQDTVGEIFIQLKQF